MGYQENQNEIIEEKKMFHVYPKLVAKKN